MGLKAPVVAADAGYGVSTPLRHGLQERGLSYVLALTGKEVAHELNIEPHQPDYGGLGPPTLARYRTAPRALFLHAAEAAATGHFTEVAWRQGSKGTMTSRFAPATVLLLDPTNNSVSCTPAAPLLPRAAASPVGVVFVPVRGSHPWTGW